jgi:hypothetical protein
MSEMSSNVADVAASMHVASQNGQICKFFKSDFFLNKLEGPQPLQNFINASKRVIIIKILNKKGLKIYKRSLTESRCSDAFTPRKRHPSADSRFCALYALYYPLPRSPSRGRRAAVAARAARWHEMV